MRVVAHELDKKGYKKSAQNQKRFCALQMVYVGLKENQFDKKRKIYMKELLRNIQS